MAGAAGVRRDRARHGAPRPPQRAREHPGQDAREPVLGVRGQGRAGPVGRRRQVPPGLLVRRVHARRPGAPHARVQSVAPRDRQSGRRGLGARAPAPARRHARRPGAADPDPRRRRDRGAGRQPGMPEHGADPRLLHGRHHPHRRQQPDRLHDVRPARRARHDVLHRHREDGRRAGPPRERRRPGGRACSPSRSRSSTASGSTGRVHRPRLLPPPRATTRPTSRWSRSRSCTSASRSTAARASSTRTGWWRRA